MPLRILLNSRLQMPSTLPLLKVMLVNKVLGTNDCSNSLFIPCSKTRLFRQTAMDNASKNAKDMIGTLQMKYNRGRQAAITNELVDIITGKFKILHFVIPSPYHRILLQTYFALQFLLNWDF
jgi:ATP synthase